MPYDIASNVAPRLDTGSFMQFQTPAGAPLFTSDEPPLPVGVVLRARNSKVGMAALRENGNRRIREASSSNPPAPSVERGENDVTELLVACTVEFRGIELLDGEAVVPTSPEFARRFWSDDRFVRERNRANDWISSEANFTKA